MLRIRSWKENSYRKMHSIIFNGLKHIATLASGSGKNKKLFILIYHRVLSEPDYMRPGEVDIDVFTWQMELLAKYFNVLPLADALEKLKNNQLPARAVCITFDDGYADNYLNALPILQKFNLKATFFIATGYLNGGIMWNDKVIEAVRRAKNDYLDLTQLGLGKISIKNSQEKAQAAQLIIKNIKHLDMEKRQQLANQIAAMVKGMPTDLMMTNEQLTKLHQAGMEIGGHTVTHPIMAKLNEQETERELTENKLALEKLLNTKIRFFAYPNGKPGQDYLPEQVKEIRSHNYQAAVSTQWGVADRTTDLFQLPRFTPWDTDPLRFMLRMIQVYIR